MTVLYQDCLVVPVVSETSDKDSAAEKGYLKCLYVYIDSILVPYVGSKHIRNDRREYPVEVEQEED